MRWKRDKIEIDSKRVVVKFALIPLDIGNETIWLEKFFSHQVYIKSYCGPQRYWMTTKWVSQTGQEQVFATGV